MHEIETKILGVNKQNIVEKMKALKAEMLQETLLKVDWYRRQDAVDGKDEWYLRIRTYSNGKSEVTWKGKSEILGVSRKHKEINFEISEPEKMDDLFLEIGLVKYAHQEKYRTSWVYKNWRFDLDQYPDMPAYLEIEGESDESIGEAITLLDLAGYKTSAEGEKAVIEKEYSLNWYKMEFK